MLSELCYEAECLQLNTCPDCYITLEACCVHLARRALGKATVAHFSTIRAQVPIHHNHESHYGNPLLPEEIHGSGHSQCQDLRRLGDNKYT
jgi:hypothetical protein